MPPKKKAARKKSARKKRAAKKARQKASSSKRFGLRRFFLSPFLLIFWLTRNLSPWAKWPLRAGLSAGFVGLSLFLIGLIFYTSLASTYDLEMVRHMPARSEILDRHGNILKNSKGQEVGFLHGKNRHLIHYEDVAPVFIDALIAREDARFRDHGAIDPRGVARAIFRLVTRGRLEGASTLTMQLARNSYQLKTTRENVFTGIHRKLLEIAIAHRIERNFTKNEIIEHYMNRIFWGGSIRGIGAAARTYFQKPATDLTLSEAALLAGIIRAPNAFSPFRDLEKSRRERDTVLDRMAKYGFIDLATAEATKKKSLDVPSDTERLIQGSYALDAIRRDLERILERENIKDGGLVIRTTLDPNIQRIAQQAVERRLTEIERTVGYRHPKRSQWKTGTPKYLQGASVVIDNATGGVLAIVGGRNASESQYNRALQARRPLASTFKPFVFLAAFDRGLRPRDPVSDARLQPGEIAGIPENWSPNNSDGHYYRSIPAARALIESRNTSTIRVGSQAGLSNVIEVARNAGFNHDAIERSPVSLLGNWGATVEEVASAYTIFPNGGVRYRPYYIQSIEDREGRVLFKNGPLPYRAANAEAAWQINGVLEQVNTRGTGRSIRTRFGFTKPSAGKTGTSNNYVDGWYAGYTSHLTCAVWVGLDHPATVIPKGDGSRLALPIWADIMKSADRLPGYQAGKLIIRAAEEYVEDQPSIPMALPVNE